jgi:hypothetical protein
MKYYLDLFTPETWQAFRDHGATVSGFREKQLTTAERVNPGDLMLCYMVRLSRWCGMLQVESALYKDASPIFSDPDPFVIRFKVRPLVILDNETSIPMLDDSVWPHLSTTKDVDRGRRGWAQQANVRSSLREIPPADAKHLHDLLLRQSTETRQFPLTDSDLQKLGQKLQVRRLDRSVFVEVPGDADREEEALPQSSEEIGPRESHKVQAAIARIGAQMGFRIWVPRADRQKVLEQLSASDREAFIDVLPLNYDDTTIKTIEQIDVLWLKNRSMARAFEVEHTTAIYSGLLRMADLLALQPNMDIALHIVAPSDKREKVLKEIKRPVFSFLERAPLYECCSYLPYEAIAEIGEIKHLGHMNDSLLEEYEEFAEDE